MIYRFGNFELDDSARELRDGGQRVVAISAFPGLMGGGGDLGRLFSNAVRWAGRR